MKRGTQSKSHRVDAKEIAKCKLVLPQLIISVFILLFSFSCRRLMAACCSVEVVMKILNISAVIAMQVKFLSVIFINVGFDN